MEKFYPLRTDTMELWGMAQTVGKEFLDTGRESVIVSRMVKASLVVDP